MRPAARRLDACTTAPMDVLLRRGALRPGRLVAARTVAVRRAAGTAAARTSAGTVLSSRSHGDGGKRDDAEERNERVLPASVKELFPGRGAGRGRQGIAQRVPATEGGGVQSRPAIAARLEAAGPFPADAMRAVGSAASYYDRNALTWVCGAPSSRSQMHPTRSLLSIAVHHATTSPGGKSQFLRAFITTPRHSLMSCDIKPSSLIST